MNGRLHTLADSSVCPASENNSPPAGELSECPDCLVQDQLRQLADTERFCCLRCHWIGSCTICGSILHCTHDELPLLQQRIFLDEYQVLRSLVKHTLPHVID